MAEKEYIEREALIEEAKHNKAVCQAIADIVDVKDIINNTPVADVAPIRHGHWKKGKGNERPTENGFVHDNKYVCDCCGWGCCCETKLDFSFCPNCGAKMDGGEENG